MFHNICFLPACFILHCASIDNLVAFPDQDTMMMGADFYETELEVAEMLKNGKTPLGVGANSRISNCIIDKNARIGKNVIIANTDAST